MLFKSATSRNIFSTVALGVVTTIGVAATVVGISYGAIRGAGIDKMQTAASEAAAEVNRTLSVAHEMVAGLDYSVSALRQQGIADRELVMAVLTKTLQGFPGAIGLSTGWEPNAFDGKDAEFVSKPVHDQTGRFVPYIYRAGGVIKTDVLVDYDTPGAGDYYQLPVKTGKTVLLEPYVYPVDGKDVLMTTISIPVMENGKALGYVGADIDLDKTAADLAAKRPLGDGYIALLSSANAFVSHPDKAAMGKALKDSGLDAAAWEGLLKSPGSVGTMVDKDGVERMAIAVPIEPFPGAIWKVVVAVPSATVLGVLTETVWTSALIIAGATIILIVVGWLLARRFIGRINRVIGQTTDIAAGRLDVELTDKDRSDELGDLS
ncbi:MAG: HAMP domain-containing protein, partial [Allorhizobium sp.]